MISLKKEFLSKNFIQFVIFGGFAAMVNFLSRIAFSQELGYGLAIVFAYFAGMLTAYTFDRFLVFGESMRTARTEFFLFIIINILGLLQTLVVSVSLADIIFPYFGLDFYNQEVAHFFGMSVPAFTSYLGHKYVTFRNSEYLKAKNLAPSPRN